MGIRLVLSLVLIMGLAIAWWAQFGEGALLATTTYLQQALEKLGRGEVEEGLVQALWAHTRYWKAVLYMGIAVFVLAAIGFGVLPKAKHHP
jgi:cyanate permease